MTLKERLQEEVNETYFIQCPFCDKQEESMIGQKKSDFIEDLIKDGWSSAPEGYLLEIEGKAGKYCCSVCSENIALQEKDTGRIIKNNSQ